MNKEIKTNSIHFHFTNNYWVNNGLAILLSQSKRKRSLAYEVDFSGIKLTTKSKNIYDELIAILHSLAAGGTFNFSASFKIINSALKKNYSPPRMYPTNEEEIKELKEVGEDDIKILKERKKTDIKKQKVWRARSNYLKLSGKKNYAKNYIKYGLKFNKQDEYNRKLLNLKQGNKQCIFCGSLTNSLIDLKESFNPFSGEHHNNVLDGVSAQESGREKNKCCSKCFLLSQFSVFNYYIPFYSENNNTVYAIPNSSNIEILVKVQNNLSTPGQYVEFKAPDCESYAANIKDLPYGCPEAGMLALLHNIKNRYSKEEREDIGFFFDELTKDELIEIREWTFVANSITHLKADIKIFNLLDPIVTEKGELFLLTNALKWFPRKYFDENEIRKFFQSILLLNMKTLSESLFLLGKTTMKKNFNYNSSFENFKRFFLEIILKEAFMLDGSIRSACKNTAKTIGRAFCKDVGMLTKFAYASGVDSFKNAIEDASFRIAKNSALEGKTSSYINADCLDVLMTTLKSDNFEEIKNYFVSFMSAYVISSNYSKEGNKK